MRVLPVWIAVGLLAVAGLAAAEPTDEIDDRLPVLVGLPVDVPDARDRLPTAPGAIDCATAPDCVTSPAYTPIDVSELTREAEAGSSCTEEGCADAAGDGDDEAATSATSRAPAPSSPWPDGPIFTLSLAFSTTAGLGAALPLVRLYRRMTRDEVLANPSRQEARRVVRDRPGATAATVAEKLDISYQGAR